LSPILNLNTQNLNCGMGEEITMKKLEGMVCLPHRLLVSFPTRPEKTDRPIEKILNDISVKMSEAFGGVSQWDAEGCWVDSNKNLVCEPVKLFYSAFNCSSPAGLREVLATIKKAGKEAHQEALFVSADETAYIFSPRAATTFFVKEKKI